MPLRLQSAFSGPNPVKPGKMIHNNTPNLDTFSQLLDAFVYLGPYVHAFSVISDRFEISRCKCVCVSVFVPKSTAVQQSKYRRC